ncbi:MAG: mannose-1-phosphate guanylyltransferase [Bacteroidales bacterium]
MELKSHLYCVIMAGGIGTRFWPLSKLNHPKQFIDILGTGTTLIQQTFERLKKICPKENIFVVTNDIYKSLCHEQLPELDFSQILCEPHRRNTAPCIAYANQKIQARDPEAVIVVAPSDHIILREDIFIENVESAIQTACENDFLVTLGIRPNRPDTNYGYIQYDLKKRYNKNPKIRKVKVFTEKPNIELAKSFVESGDFLWNSGMFIWSLKTISEAFKKHLPEIEGIFKEGKNAFDTPKEEEFLDQAYTICKSISIDYGIMEKADNVYVLESDFGWSDLGTWDSMFENQEKDQNNNAIVGENVMIYNSKNCVINMPSDKLVVLQGLNDYIVVEDGKILMVCKKSDEEQIRQFITDIKMEKGEEYI